MVNNRFLPATYLQPFPFGALSEAACFSLWEFPKYLFFVWVMGVAGNRYLGRTQT